MRTAVNDRGTARLRRMKKTVAVSVLAKVVFFGSQMVIVGAALRYLGQEEYGLWMTVIAALGWISFGQFGIGPGLVNSLGEANGHGDTASAGMYFTSAIFIMTIVAIVLFLSILAVLPLVDLANTL